MSVREQFLVRYENIFEASSAKPLEEWVPAELLRPQPPPTPSAWRSALQVGSPLEMQHEGGWWQVHYISTSDGTEPCDATRCLVYGRQWGDGQVLVDVDALRPGWHWRATLDVWTTRLSHDVDEK
uniref:Agenet-like domain-containing protein n=1 Tax=Calcidiscus leptoporus TaxID=127549 RepID=A0A7S0J2T6_9EUKA